MNDQKLPILTIVEVSGTVRLPDHPDIPLNRRCPLVKDGDGFIYPLELNNQMRHHERMELGVEDEIIIVKDAKDGREKMFLRIN